MEREDVQLFLERLDKCLGKVLVEGKLLQGGKEREERGKEKKDRGKEEERENGFDGEDEGRK